MIRIRVGTMLLALLLTGCGSSGGSAPSSPASTWTPAGVGPTVEVRIADGTNVNARVGQRLHFAEADDIVTSPQPADLDRLTWYGDPRTFLALAPGTVTVDIPNYDRHFDCPNGPCAHPNAPLHMTVTIAAGTGPRVPAPIPFTGAAAVTLAVGQRLTLPKDTQVAVGDGPECAVVTSTAVVGMRPGTQVLYVGAGSRPVTVTVSP